MNNSIVAVETLGRLSRDPWALAPAGVPAALATLAGMARGEKLEPLDAGLEVAAVYGVTSEADRPYAFDRASGVAFIPVRGVLLNRFSGSYSGATGYQAIRSMFQAAEATPDVRGIVFDHNSPGGDAQGVFELAAEIRAGKKPTAAIVDANSYSASYALAAAADRVYVTPSGGVGSVGVYTMHVDMSKMLTDIGYDVTLIFSGDHKVDGNPFEPMPDSVKADVQARVDARRQEFAAQVAAGRNMTSEAVLDTEARTYSAAEGVEIGFADAVMAPQDAFADFVGRLPSSAAFVPSTLSEAVMAETDTAAAKAAAASAERARVKAIAGHDAASAHPSLANHLAYDTDLSAEQAAGILAAAALDKPKAAAAPAASPFEKAMGQAATSTVGDSEKTEDLSAAQLALQSLSLATGRKFNK